MTRLTTDLCAVTHDSPAALYLATLTRGPSRQTQTSALSNVLRVLGPANSIDTFEWHKVPFERYLQLRDELARKLAPATANRYLAAIRGVIAAAWRLRLLSTEEYARLVDFASVKGSRQTRRRMLSQPEVVRLFEAAKSGRTEWFRKRDAAIVAMLYTSGARRAEIAAMHLDDLRFEADGTICMNVIGKGNKEREIWVSGQIKPALNAWIAIRGEWRGVLFPSKRWVKRPLHPEGVTSRVRSLAKWAGLGHLTPHDLRRTCFSTLLDAGVDINVVKDIAGHTKIATTAKYDLRGERAVRAAAGKLPIPFSS